MTFVPVHKHYSIRFSAITLSMAGLHYGMVGYITRVISMQLANQIAIFGCTIV